MEEITLPPVLINLIHNINSQGHLKSWQLKSTLETHSLTLEWTRTTTCNINDYQSVGSDSTLQSLEKKSDQSVVSNEDCGDEYSSQAIYVTEKDATCEHSDFPSGLQRILEDEVELYSNNECETPEAMLTEDKIKYETQISFQGEPHKFSTMNKTQDCRRNSGCKTPIHSSPLENKRYFADHRTNELADQRVSGTHSNPLLKQVSRKERALCSCGGVFSSRNSSVIHLLSTCPVSLCFRIELEYDIQQVLDSWHGDEKDIGMAWWQSYKTNGFPDATTALEEKQAKQLETLVSQFIQKAMSQKLKDHNGNAFVMMRGLKDLQD